MQWAVAVTTLNYSEHLYVGMTVLLLFLLFLAVLPTYRRMYKFIILIHFLALYKNNACTFSVLMLLREMSF